MTNKDADYFLDLLGPIEPAAASLSDAESAWRLQSYHGTPADNDAIERAVTRVQRTFPFVDFRVG